MSFKTKGTTKVAGIHLNPELSVVNPIVESEHRVQFYETDAFLTEHVGDFALDALQRGEPLILIATPEHVAQVEEYLIRRGLSIPELCKSGRIGCLDAQETLDRFIVEGQPNPKLFEETVGALVRSFNRDGKRVHAFGEMVALLCTQGNPAAAVHLEDLWNDLAAKHSISLLCAYPLDSFSLPGQEQLFRHICRQHDRLMPTEAVNEQPSVDDKPFLIAELQRRAKVLEREVENRKRAEGEARRREQELAVFFETTTLGLHWVSEDGTIIWANGAEMEMLGYAPSEYIGHPIADFYVDKELIADIMQRLRGGDIVHGQEAVLRCKDGTLKTAVVDSSVLWDEGRFVHTQCITRDITSEKRGEMRLRHFAAMVDSSDDAIISKDLNGVITSWNKAAERIFGYTAEEAVGKSVTILIPPERFDEEPSVLSRIRAGKRIDHYETIRVRKDGGMVDISLTVSPIYDSQGKIVGASKIARNITDQVLDRHALQVLNDELVKAKDELEHRVEERTKSLQEAVAQMEEFSYTVSHDIRAPLRAMDMYAKVLLEDYGHLVASEPDAIRYLSRISENCARLDRMIMDVLTYGRVARGGLKLEPVSLDFLVSDLIRHYPTLQPDHADIEVAPLGHVVAHEPSLMQVISNLLGNAVKFVAPGIRPKVKIWSEPRDGKLRVWIEDNGIGINPEYQHRLFGLFERLHPELGYEGTGVGLAIVGKAMQRMGGRVGVQSDGEHGSRFWIEMPVPKDSQ